jgi:hypothetical protein
LLGHLFLQDCQVQVFLDVCPGRFARNYIATTFRGIALLHALSLDQAYVVL